jgi:quercetin dioxygenase-like cupin family protein
VRLTKDVRGGPERVDYDPGGSPPSHRHLAGAYVSVMDGSLMFGIVGEGETPTVGTS